MKTIILAAGVGSRAEGEVKALMDIGGKTIISRMLDQLSYFGIWSPVIVVGHHFNEIMTHLAIMAHRPIYIYNDQYASTGSAESLNLAINALHPEEDFLVIYGDTVFDMLTVASIAPSPNTAALTPYDGKGGRVYTAGGRITVPSSGSIPCVTSWSWAGIARMKVSLELLDENAGEGAVIALTAGMNAIHGRSVNVNTPSDLEDARRFCA